jgi:hypothetical protein
MIMIGLNKGADAKASSISGSTKPTHTQEAPIHYIILGWTVGLLIVFIIVAILYKAKYGKIGERN